MAGRTSGSGDAAAISQFVASLPQQPNDDLHRLNLERRDLQAQSSRHVDIFKQSGTQLDFINDKVDAMSEQERFVRYGTTDRKTIVDNEILQSKKIEKFNEAASTLEGMSSGQLFNRFGTTDKDSIYTRLGYDKQFLREIGLEKAPGQNDSSNPKVNVSSVGNQALLDQMNNSNFAKDAANIIKQNPVLQKSILGEVVYKPGESAAAGRTSGKMDAQDKALELIKQMKAQQPDLPPGIHNTELDKYNEMENKILNATVDNATFSQRDLEQLKADSRLNEMKYKDEMQMKKLKLLMALSGNK